MERKVKLMPDANGNQLEVVLDTGLSIRGMRQMQDEGLISKTFLNELVLVEEHPEKMNFNDMMNAAYIAYANANPSGMSKDEFEDRFPNDITLLADLYSEIISGSAKSDDLVKDFKRATPNSKRKSKKKYRK